MKPKKSLGFIVNPISGMGGEVGLKGTDGQEILQRAREMGAAPKSPRRAVEALRRLALSKDTVRVVTGPYDMGEDEAKECGFDPVIVGSVEKGKTTCADTKRIVLEMAKMQVDLILFSGGDGTARDIQEVVGETIPALGIPAGVKIHSAVFGVNPRSAGDLALDYLQGRPVHLHQAEVIDVDEQAFREDRLSTRLYGYLRVPYESSLVQSAKAGGAAREESSVRAIACDVIDNMGSEIYVMGPGTTTKVIMDALGLKKTLLGVDVVRNRKLVLLDANKSQILEAIGNDEVKIVISVIGGQGFILGRGNQQISPEVIRKAGKENIIVVATPEKLASLRGRPLLADTGNDGIDGILSGYMNVVTGYGRRARCKLGVQLRDTLPETRRGNMDHD